jgi:hypothetical protein
MKPLPVRSSVNNASQISIIYQFNRLVNVPLVNSKQSGVAMGLPERFSQEAR